MGEGSIFPQILAGFSGLQGSPGRLARHGVTKSADQVTDDQDALVTDDVTKVTWRETHLRAFLKHLAYTDGDAGTLAKSEPQTRDRAGGDLDPCG